MGRAPAVEIAQEVGYSKKQLMASMADSHRMITVAPGGCREK